MNPVVVAGFLPLIFASCVVCFATVVDCGRHTVATVGRCSGHDRMVVSDPQKNSGATGHRVCAFSVYNFLEAICFRSGRTLGDLSYASVDTFENPRIVMPRMARAMAAAAPNAATPAPTEDSTPQTVTATAHVNALFSLK